jgi:hypothetical protein
MMRKSAFLANRIAGIGAITGATLILVLISNPIAWAEDEKSATSTVEIESDLSELSPIEKSGSEDKREELEKKYGKQGHLSVPPLVVRPMNNSDGSALGIIVDPTRNSPIDISKARFTKMTPAERFIQVSQIGLLVMALGSIVLILVAVSRAIRRK